MLNSAKKSKFYTIRNRYSFRLDSITMVQKSSGSSPPCLLICIGEDFTHVDYEPDDLSFLEKEYKKLMSALEE